MLLGLPESWANPLLYLPSQTSQQVSYSWLPAKVCKVGQGQQGLLRETAM